MVNLEYLKQIVNDDPEQIKDLLRTFFLVTQEDILNLSAAINNQQDSLVASVAHRIKGGAIIIGANQMATLTAELEQKAMTPDPQNYVELFDQIEANFIKLREYCVDILPALKDGDSYS